MIRFGPGGNSDSFYAQGYQSTFQAFAWLRKIGLEAYEYQGGKGLSLKEETARKIGEEAKQNGIALSLHAPYYINLANPDNSKMEKSMEHVRKSAQAARWMQADRIIVHAGSPGDLPREKALERVIQMFGVILEEHGDQISWCPELMGKINQIGSLEEIIRICQSVPFLVPAIDFGHLNARTLGKLNSSQAFSQAVEALVNGLGIERVRCMHVHFSRIEHTRKGEKRHWRLEDEEYGPDFAHLIPVLKNYSLEPVIICESEGTMAEDALKMKEMYFYESDVDKWSKPEYAGT